MQISDEYSSLIVAQLLYLQSEDPKMPVHMYINSPGGLFDVYMGRSHLSELPNKYLDKTLFALPKLIF